MPAPANLGAEAGPKHVLMSWDPRFGADRYRVQVSTQQDFGAVVEDKMTQTTNHAPLLTQTSYGNGGTYYWRVAFLDEANDLGDFSAPQSFALPKLLRLSAFGSPQKGVYGDISVTVTNAVRNPVRYANACVSGAGISKRCKKTSSTGRATFRVKPTRYRKVYVT